MRAGDAYMRRWTGLSLDKILACCLFGAKPCLKKTPKYCQLELRGHISMTFSFETILSKMSSVKFGHFVSTKVNIYSFRIWQVIRECDAVKYITIVLSLMANYYKSTISNGIKQFQRMADDILIEDPHTGTHAWIEIVAMPLLLTNVDNRRTFLWWPLTLGVPIPNSLVHKWYFCNLTSVIFQLVPWVDIYKNPEN